jgi:uncharacterized membrane protein YqjE
MPDAGRPAGLLGSLRELLAQALAVLLTRGELAALELADARDRAVRWLIIGLVGAVLLLAALVTVSLWIAALFWDGPRALALGLLALAYALGGLVAIGIVRREAAQAPTMLAQTRAELQKDRDALAGQRRGSDDPG